MECKTVLKDIGMIIVIDAYNVLKKYVTEVSESQRIQFIKQCGTYGKRKGHKMVVVFDAGPYDYPTIAREHGAYVAYSGVRESADQYIKRYFEEHKNQDLLLVSSDNELGQFASHREIPSLDSSYFYRILRQELEKKGGDGLVKKQKIVKTTAEEAPELDQLMEEASKTVPTKSEDIVGDVLEKDSHKRSKRERKLLEKIKKL